MKDSSKRAIKGTGVVVGVLVVAALGFVLGGLVLGTRGYDSAVTGPDAVTSSAPELAEERAGGSAQGYDTAPQADKQAADPGAPAQAESMVVRNASMELRVDDVDPAVARLRSAASANGAEITSLSVYRGDQGPRPLTAPEDTVPGPATASVTLRVPAEGLEKLQADVSEIGAVISQSSSADDVTEQYVDLQARLKNLKAQEAQLRSFFSRARRVEDLLAIEQELSRVRGEIEAMQAQVDYLERQADRATLSVTLTEPGPLVQPAGADWGFSEAIRRGIQAAATLVTGLITLLIAVAPLLLAGLLVWLAVRAIRRRRHAKTDTQAAGSDGEE